MAPTRTFSPGKALKQSGSGCMDTPCQHGFARDPGQVGPIDQDALPVHIVLTRQQFTSVDSPVWTDETRDPLVGTLRPTSRRPRPRRSSGKPLASSVTGATFAGAPSFRSPRHTAQEGRVRPRTQLETPNQTPRTKRMTSRIETSATVVRPKTPAEQCRRFRRCLRTGAPCSGRSVTTVMPTTAPPTGPYRPRSSWPHGQRPATGRRRPVKRPSIWPQRRRPRSPWFPKDTRNNRVCGSIPSALAASDRRAPRGRKAHDGFRGRTGQ